VPDSPFTYVDVSSIDKNHGCIGDGVQVLRPEDAPSRARKIVKRGTVIYSTVRPYLLNIAVVDREFDPAPIVSTAFFVMHPHPELDGHFLFYYLRSQPFTEYVNGAMTGMAYPAVNDSKMSVGPFPLPPLPEQKRIVARVDELMKRCDALEARQKERHDRHTVLVPSCLHALATKPETSSFLLQPSAFSLLLTTPASVAELRKTILQLAVQGRLVPQEKAHHEGHEEHEGEDADHRNQCSPHANVPGWIWTRFGEYLVRLQTGPFGSSLHKSDYVQGGIPVINPMHMTEKGIEPTPDMTVSPATIRRLAVFRMKSGNIIMARRGEVGRCAVVTPGEDGWLCGTGSLLLSLPQSAYPPFFCMLLRSPLAREYLGGAAVGTTMVNLNQRILLDMLVGIPPLAEQKRIVAKVNELMALCDALDAKLTQSRADADTLAAAIVHRLCNDRPPSKESAA
jgi:type I restriction enzyme, S subunit